MTEERRTTGLGSRMNCMILAFLLFCARSHAQIYKVDPAGGHPERLKQLPIQAESIRTLSYKPDGKRIAIGAFVENHGRIYLVNSDGTGFQQVGVLDMYAPTFTPDGKKLLVTGGLRTPTLYLIGLDGSGQSAIKSDAQMGSFSPDGTKIVFMRRAVPSEEEELFICNADGSSERQITHMYSATTGPAFNPINGPKGPAFDPRNSAHVLYSNSRLGSSSFDISLVDISNLNVHTILNLAGAMPVSDRVALSPDGKMIAFSRTASETPVKFDIMMSNVDGTGLRNLTSSLPSVNAGVPAFSPDGKALIFVGIPAD